MKNTDLKIISDKPLHILLAEDHILNQKLAVAYLTNFGLEVDLAENGIEAIEKFRQKPYDLILMDIQMPVMDGYHAAQKIREEFNSKVPIIAMTAHMMANEREKCATYGMDDYLSKPFKETELFNIVNAYLGNKESVAIISDETSTEQKTTFSQNDPVINIEHLYTLSRGNISFIKDITSLFINQNPTEISELEKSIRQKEYPAIRSISHKMKTSVGFMGITRLSVPLAKLEELAINHGNMMEMETISKEVKAVCKKAITELTGFLTQLEQQS